MRRKLPALALAVALVLSLAPLLSLSSQTAVSATESGWKVIERGPNFISRQNLDNLNRFSWESAPQWVQADNGDWVPYVYERDNDKKCYKIQSGLIATEIDDKGIASFYDPSMADIRVKSETWRIEYWDGEGWKSEMSLSGSIVFDVIPDGNNISIKWTQSTSKPLGVLQTTYIFREGSALKHEVVWTSGEGENITVRVKQVWDLKETTKEVSNVKLDNGGTISTDGKFKSAYYLFQSGVDDYLVFESQWKMMHDENGEELTGGCFTGADIKFAGKKVIYTFENWTLARNGSLTIDPDTATLSDPTEDGYIRYDGGTSYYRYYSDVDYIFFGNSHYALYYNRERGYVEWDISSIPDGATITDTIFKYHGLSHEVNSWIYAMTSQPTAQSYDDIGGKVIWDDAAEGTAYISDSATFPEVGATKQIDLGASADSDLQAALINNWFAVGLKGVETTDAEYNLIYSEEYATADPKPTLYVEYTPPPPPNVAPEVLNSFAPASVDPNAAFDVKVEVRDNDLISDIEEVWLKVYENTKSQGDADSVRDHYTFKYDATTTTWSEIGPDTGGSHINEGSCVAGDDEKTTDNFTFNIVLAKTACSGDWDVWGKVIDSASEEDSEEFLAKFSVNDYISVALDDSTLTFSGDVGQSDVVPSEQPTVATVSSNVDFNIKVKLSGNWSGGRGGFIEMANTQAAQDASHTGEVNLSSSYQTLWPSVGYGEGVARNIYWFLDFPTPLLDDDYSNIFYVQVVKI